MIFGFVSLGLRSLFGRNDHGLPDPDHPTNRSSILFASLVTISGLTCLVVLVMFCLAFSWVTIAIVSAICLVAGVAASFHAAYYE